MLCASLRRKVARRLTTHRRTGAEMATRQSAITKAAKVIERQMNAVEKVRDKLDDDIDTLKSLREDCDEAYENLIAARDALSRLV